MAPPVRAPERLVTLTMILKNEAATIARTLETVKPWIDRWVGA